MIPQSTFDQEQDFVIVQEPSNTHKLNYDKETISGNTDGLEAIKQTIYKILSTERYRHEIYSWNYGVELQDLFGMPKSYVYPELKRRITEALLQDDRITAVNDFAFTSQRGNVTATFTVYTIFGELQSERTVNI
jgi:phage baseplate assembly protein W